jgi:hypothetical protein
MWARSTSKGAGNSKIANINWCNNDGDLKTSTFWYLLWFLDQNRSNLLYFYENSLFLFISGADPRANMMADASKFNPSHQIVLTFLALHLIR